jgi:hypothetical protein
VRCVNNLVDQGDESHVGHDWENDNALTQILRDNIMETGVDFQGMQLEWKRGKY